MNLNLIKEALWELGVTPPPIFLYDKTDSTNERAREYARLHPENKAPALFIAEEQTAGRGRRGRRFFSEKGVGIYMSALLFPDERGAELGRITARSAVALSEAISSLAPVSPGIKWVNDLYLNGKKIAGILAEGETSPDGEAAYLVLGMGINVYKTPLPEEISDIATSIEAECKAKISREALIARIIKNLLFSALSEKELLEKYRSLSLVIGKQIAVLPYGIDSYPATAIKILDDYSLLVRREDGGYEKLSSGEVSTKITGTGN